MGTIILQNFEEKSNNYFLFQYGPAQGIPDCRVHLAKFLSDGYDDAVSSNDLVLTSGASNGMHLVLSTLLDMDGIIFVDEMTYMIALEAFSQFNLMKIIPVPMTENGVDINVLEKSIEKYITSKKTSNKLFSMLYYTIPTFHNPTGILFSEGCI